ncbi:hypothetical protein FH972_021770 [Carpinus fangiana]|uniref:Nuclear pore protein n=1 Tax=Carpinus fangiana TaxID=176857 RepID=A0A5N6KQ96_9ROSI|nr:hypothetical protein FH972_021770 [Carpinus fangiana]
MEQTKRDFDSFLDDHIQMNLDVQRRRVYEHFGLARPSEDLGASFAGAQSSTGPNASRGAFGRSSRRSKFGNSEKGGSGVTFGASGMNKSILGGSTLRGSTRTAQFADVADKSTSVGSTITAQDPFLRSKQDKYATKVRELNISRLQQVVYPVIEEFAKVEIDSGSDTSAQLVDAYKALKEIVQENPSVQRPSDPGAIRERQYIKSYLDETPSSGTSLQMRKQILNGSRKFLENNFYQSVEDMISRNPQQAQLGGVPSKVNKVRAYVKLRGDRKDLTTEQYELQIVNDDYCWALIYYLLRAGLVQEAAKYVSENERPLKNMDRHFTQYMRSYASDSDRRLPRDMQTRISAEYHQRTRIAPEKSIDPYRMACYKIIGRCDISRKTIEGVSAGIEDFLWLNFSLAREVNRVEEAATDVFGLEEARNVITEVGQRHFAPGNESGPGYATFFLMQILAGMFEQAIAWLYPHNYVAAVHFAIALDFYGLLRVSDFDVSASELLTYTTRQKPQICFCRMMGYYTQDFRISNAEAAADYLTLICINSDLPGQVGKAQAAVCHEALKELVLVTREFALLLGDMNSDGRRIQGAIEQRVDLLSLENQQEFLKSLTIQAASAADDSGRTTDAVLLYHLAEEYDNVVVIINRALSDALAVDIGQEPMRLQPLKPRDANAPPPDAASSNSSLSLTSVDDPAILARNMITLYNANAAYYARIRQPNRDACGLLLRIHDVKTLVATGQWALAIDTVKATSLLPLEAGGNISVIRSHAQQLHAMPSVVSRNVGNLLIWTITACGKHREVLRSSAFDVGGRGLIDSLAGMAKDMMVFAGLIRYKLSPGVFEALARAGQGVESA